MRICFWGILFNAFVLVASPSTAQTLTEQLTAEDPARLVELARNNGNIVRGAILFHQGNLNCAKCHRPTAERDRIGPDLSRMDQQSTDQFIVESILQPSRTIKKGFETVTALTVDGQLINGLIVREDDQTLVLRDSQNVDRVISIQREDLDEIRDGRKSSMPDGLADELKNRQQFLDLLRYVIDVWERGQNTDVATTGSAGRRELSPELQGLVLIQKLNCVACHKSDVLELPVAARIAPRLQWSGKWLNPEYLSQFIAAPQDIEPGSTMPQLPGGLTADAQKEAASAITHYITATAQNEFRHESADSQAVQRGYTLFQSVGCVACHSPRNESGVEQPLEDSIPLGDLQPKYSIGALVQFLENPLDVRPSGHMPDMQLTHREALDISNYLLQSSENPSFSWQIDADLVQQGKSLFYKYNCAACHSGLEDADPGQSDHTPLDKLDVLQGCLSGDSGAWPDVGLLDQERELIRSTLNRFPLKLESQQQIDVTLALFNCIACHDRDGLGGVSDQRNLHFQTTNLNLGDQGRIPPTLTGVGAKLNSKWMRDVLVNRRRIRPYMKTRMPQYGEENVGHLISLFQTCDQLETTRFADFEDQKEMRKKGLELAGNKGLNCVACHTCRYKLSDTMPAVDLTEMAERLKKEWFYQYMLSPQKFSPNTVMPSFWPGGVAIRKDIDGKPEFQIEALWQYLIDGRQAAMPAGVVREQLEIVVDKEAEMLRRRYPGIGKRGIGVGYPGGVNLAFDAEQMRLAMIWKGRFVDPGGVWTGQGSGNVRPLGRTINLARGPEIDDSSNPWVVDDGRPPDHKFKGYVLDPVRRPAFRYVFDTVDVVDFFTDCSDESSENTHLRRSVTLSTAEHRGHLRFRIASANQISVETEGRFKIADQFTIRVVSGHPADIVDESDGKSLQIPLNLEAGQPQEIVIEYLWE